MFQEFEAPRLQDNRHIKVGRLSALRTGHLYPPGNIPGTLFYYRPSQPQGHSAAGRIMSIKNYKCTIEKRTFDLPAYRAVPQPTALPTAPVFRGTGSKIEASAVVVVYMHVNVSINSQNGLKSKG